MGNGIGKEVSGVGSVSEVAFQASTSREATERSTSNLRSTCEVPPLPGIDSDILASVVWSVAR